MPKMITLENGNVQQWQKNPLSYQEGKSESREFLEFLLIACDYCLLNPKPYTLVVMHGSENIRRPPNALNIETIAMKHAREQKWTLNICEIQSQILWII